MNPPNLKHIFQGTCHLQGQHSLRMRAESQSHCCCMTFCQQLLTLGEKKRGQQRKHKIKTNLNVSVGEGSLVIYIYIRIYIIIYVCVSSVSIYIYISFSSCIAMYTNWCRDPFGPQWMGLQVHVLPRLQILLGGMISNKTY